jgi:hypothetical protein
MIGKTTGIILLAAATACSGAGRDAGQVADSTGRDLGMVQPDSNQPLNDRPVAGAGTATSGAPAQKPAPKPAPAAAKPVAMTLDTGTVVTATAIDSLHSRHNKVGDSFRVTVSQDVKDAKGRVAVPSGSMVTFKVVAIEPAKSKSDTEGKIRLEAREVIIDGQAIAVAGVARTMDVEHVLEGQGVTAGGAARVGGGAAGGAVVGGVVGGKTGAIVGGVAGAAAGTAVAVQTADRDVVVRPGMSIKWRLLLPFTVTR